MNAFNNELKSSNLAWVCHTQSAPASCTSQQQPSCARFLCLSHWLLLIRAIKLLSNPFTVLKPPHQHPVPWQEAAMVSSSGTIWGRKKESGCLHACVIDRDECILFHVLFNRRKNSPSPKIPFLEIKTEAFQTGSMNGFWLTVVQWLHLLTGLYISQVPSSITREALVWNGNRLVSSLISVPGTPLEHEMWRSQTAIALAQSVRGGEKAHRHIP